MKVRIGIGLWLLIWFCTGCATWYARTEAFHTAVTAGDFEQADKLLRKDKQMKKEKNKILFYLNRGYVAFMAGHPEESNRDFETAEQLIDEQVRQPLAQVAVLLSNPEILLYKPEDFEVIMVNFYKAMNYLQLNDMENALVEVRKINIKLNQLNDKYPDHKNRYQRDAFAHLLMGLIYDASGRYNDAFIAYRNAYETYETDYRKNFGMGAPEQLKKDLLRTASLCGFTAELQAYEKAWEMTYVPQPPSAYGQLVMFWLNGMGPVKSEWGIDFVKVKGEGGIVEFRNDQYGLTFPFVCSSQEESSLADLRTLRVAFPKYVERPLFYKGGEVNYEGQKYRFELAEDINQIAFKTLRDRMLREFSASLLRLAAKQSVEYVASKENDWLGLAVSLVNAVTEKADTRNWQTLPYTISYVRVPLKAADNTVELDFSSAKGEKTTGQVEITGQKKKTQFSVYSTL